MYPRTSCAASANTGVDHGEYCEADRIEMIADVNAGRRVLVLGAAGFIGRWVSRKLREAGADLCLAGRDGAAAVTVFSAYGISGEIAVVDLEPSRDVRELMARVKPCITFNLAGYGVDPGETAKERSHRVNVELPEILARSAFPADDASWRGYQVIHAGSALEYGCCRACRRPQ